MSSAALVLVGHGSHLDSESARPLYDHADEIRSRGVFDAVHEAFWKEAPSPREVLRTVEQDAVYVVPLFTSEGYFTEQVIPRELRIADGWNLDVDKSVYYTDPVGTHEAMTSVIARRAERVTNNPNVDSGVGLAVVGHGTERNENSARATQAHADCLREQGRFDEVRALFMDEDPRIDDLTEHFESDELVVVPLFIADGYHTQEDIPEDIGLTDDAPAGYDVPAEVSGKTVWYAGAVGTEPLVADVILERAGDAGAEIENSGTESANKSDETDSTFDHRREFLRWLESASRPISESETETRIEKTWGQLSISIRLTDNGEREYEIRHVEDRERDTSALDIYRDPTAIRDLSRFTDDGDYRPLRTAPTLPTGWSFETANPDELYRVVDWVYPATVANWSKEREGNLDVTHFEETAERQTGIYANIENLDRKALENAVVACCADSQCCKRREWDAAENDEVEVPRGDGEFPCREPCSLFVAAAREFLAVERSDAESTEPTFERTTERDADERLAFVDGVETGRPVRDGEMSDPANRYRARYRRAKQFAAER
ncbi:sirohydrochlorin cobaltochelatase [Haladaptatus litoreus]|uniref:Sirohydrochlorin cobaltochelatase n=1 Tax=Haladaptatus litoreus TaxID=553468 RepID=A0A1N6XDD5_9EURY|nr:sirohydrochlorin cobaltochelatase [Haladaptatus litoreus]